MFAVSLAFITAIALAGVAAWFSITGLMAIFAGLPISIAIMAGVLEVGKLVTASILYRNWKTIPRSIKAYLSTAVVILMLITSLGIYGYLSKAHIEQNAPVSNNVAKIERLQQRIEREERTINDAETVIAQLDNTIATLIEYDKISGPDGARAVRSNQQPQRDELNATIDAAQDRIDQYLDEKSEYEQEVRNLEREVGPIKYIAALATDSPEAHYEEAVRYIILLLIFVFDPLAVLLLITANHVQMTQLPKPEKKEEQEPYQGEDSEEESDDVYDAVVQALQEEPAPNESLQELLNREPPWGEVDDDAEEDDTAQSEVIEEPTLEELEQSSQVKDQSKEDDLAPTTTTLQQLNQQPDHVLQRMVDDLNQHERTRSLTPSEHRWRSAAHNILERRKRENPLMGVYDNNDNIG